ncbi:hypothetical protein TNCV_4533621 [Trichonephila clavipes]|nr:hypothetical protein TNCV_4533621 [Trichonephila clavipes]
MGSLAQKEHNCIAKEFEECLEALNAITQTEDLALAATREELNLVCSDPLSQGYEYSCRKPQHAAHIITDPSVCLAVGRRQSRSYVCAGVLQTYTRPVAGKSGKERRFARPYYFLPLFN